MKYALNRNKARVDALTASKAEKPFKCPACSKPVVLRKGLWNAPCFSHWPGEGSLACILFTATATRSAHRPARSDRPSQRPHELSLIRLTITGESLANYALRISIPRCEIRDWFGHIACHSAQGEYQIRATAALGELHLVVPPEGEYKFSRHGDVPDEYWAYFDDCSIGLSSTGSYFRYSTSPVQPLKDDTPLYWGERYWLFAERGRFDFADMPPTVAIETSPAHGNWNAHLLSLPPESSLSLSQVNAIERCLNRRVISEPNRIYVVDPMPHHVLRDGTLCFPEGTSPIFIRNPDKLELVASDASGSLLGVNPLSDDGLFAIFPSPLGDTRVFVDGQIALAFSINECKFFEPLSPVISSSVGTFELPMVSSENAIRKAIRNSDQLVLSAPLESLQTVLQINSKSWADNSTEWRLTTSREEPFILRIGNAGVICVEPSLGTVKLPTLEPLKPLASWLFSVSTCATGDSVYRLFLPDDSDLPFWISRLKRRSWRREYVAHLQLLRSRLTAFGAQDV